MKKIETETEYNYALAKCYILMNAKPGSLDETMLGNFFGNRRI